MDDGWRMVDGGRWMIKHILAQSYVIDHNFCLRLGSSMCALELLSDFEHTHNKYGPYLLTELNKQALAASSAQLRLRSIWSGDNAHL